MQRVCSIGKKSHGGNQKDATICNNCVQVKCKYIKTERWQRKT